MIANPTPTLAADDGKRSFDIPSEDAASALKLFAEQAGRPVIVPPTGAKDVQVNALKGEYLPDEALERLLEGTVLAAKQRATTVFRLARKMPEQDAPPPAGLDSPRSATQQAARPRIEDGRIPPASSFTLSGSEFARWGSVNAEEMLNTLPQITADRTAFSNTEGDGTATANLRGLGAHRTLVLVNGRRYIPSGLSQTVDLNTIPSFMIESVNVGTGGVAFGTDALAGTVDFRLRKVTGLELGGQYAVTGHGDGDRLNVFAALGSDFSDGKGHVTVYGEYFNRDAITQDKRGFSEVPLTDSNGALAAELSSTTPGGRFVAAPVLVPAGRGLPAVVVERGPGTTFASSQGATYTALGATSTNYTTADAYNAAADTYLQLPQRRWSFGANAEYEISPGLIGYGEVAFSANKVATQIAPTEVTGRFRINTAANARYWTAADIAAIAAVDAGEEAMRRAYVSHGIPTGTTYTTDYYLPGTGVAVLDIYRRLSEAGPRVTLNDRRAFRTLAGLKGDLSSRWNYDAYFSYASTSNATTRTGGVLLGAFTNAVELGTINVYGPGSLTPDMVKSIAVIAQDTEQANLAVGHAEVTGKLFDLGLGGGDVTLGLGGEYRRMSGQFTPDALLLSGDFRRLARDNSTLLQVVGFTPGTAAEGHYDVREAFANVQAPIAEGRPLLQLLQVNGSIRYSDYSLRNLGSTLSYTLDGVWSPDSQIALHAQFERGARAPNLQELYGFNGNAALKAERSRNLVLGAAFRPDFVPGLNLSIDHFDIDVTNMILPSSVAAVPNTNLASQKTSGWDLQVNHVKPLDFGLLSQNSRITFSFMATHTTRNDLRAGTSSAQPIALAGAFGTLADGLQAKWKWTSSLTWEDGNLSSSLRWRHLGAVRDEDTASLYVAEKIGAYSLYDLSLSYAFSNRLRVVAGVANLLDTKPPVVGSNQDQANTYPGTYDVRGRDFFVSAKTSF